MKINVVIKWAIIVRFLWNLWHEFHVQCTFSLIIPLHNSFPTCFIFSYRSMVTNLIRTHLCGITNMSHAYIITSTCPLALTQYVVEGCYSRPHYFLLPSKLKNNGDYKEMCLVDYMNPRMLVHNLLKNSFKSLSEVIMLHVSQTFF